MANKFQVLIVGMGPAGMAAAIELAGMGVHTAVVDENPKAGGQIYRQPSGGFLLTDLGFLGLKHTAGRKLVEGFESVRGKVTILNDTYVWGFFDPDKLSVLSEGQHDLMTFDKLLLAEGAAERCVPFPGWTLPGIMTLGGLQKLVVQDRVLPGHRFLLAGSNPLLFPVAKSLLDAGGEIVAFCDATKIKDHMRMIPQLLRRKSMVHEAAAYVFPVFKASLPTYRPYAVVAGQGTDRVEEVTIAKLDKGWKPIPGTEKRFKVDIVGLNYGYLPSSRLARLCGCAHVYDPIQICWKPETDRFMRSSIPRIYVAGDSAGIAGAEIAEVQGRIAAIHIAAELGRLSPRDLEARLRILDKARTRLEDYASVLNTVYTLRPGLYRAMDKKTIVCRCEQLTVEEVLAGIEWGYRNINEIKRTRVGMGFCQGRTCESATAQLMIDNGIPIEEIGYMSTRPPLSPMPLGSFEHWADLGSEQDP